jgi:hypothetical protein
MDLNMDLNTDLDMAETAKAGGTDYLQGAVMFAEYLTGEDKWPQLVERPLSYFDGSDYIELPPPPGRMTPTPVVGYYFAGSLATMLLAESDDNVIRFLDPGGLPNIVIKETLVIPKGVTDRLKDFQRKIGDLDFVPFEHYWQRLTQDRLSKGGGGPSIEELPETAKQSLRYDERTVKVMCDPVRPYGEHDVGMIRAGGREYLISSPKTIFAYKILHMLQKFGRMPEMSPKLKRDFDILHGALLEMYPEQELIETAYNVIASYEESMGEYGPKASKYMKGIENNPEYDSTVKEFFEKLKEHDRDHRTIM